MEEGAIRGELDLEREEIGSDVGEGGDVWPWAGGGAVGEGGYV